MDAVIHVADVIRKDTKAGNTRFIVKDDDGREYVTFRPQIGARAEECKGKTARIDYHEEARGQYQNVYLDGIEPIEEPTRDESVNADVAAWQVAAEAAPVLVGKARSADDLFDALKPFKDRVAADIRGEDDPHVDELAKHRANKGKAQ
jgi:hypothetical protein